MAGRELKEIYPRHGATPGAARLRVERLTRDGAFRDVSFEARAGEVVGIAGLAGAGRTELVEAIFGAWPAESGEVLVDGEAIRPHRPSRAVARGVGLVTEDRRRTGLCLNLSVANNLTLANVRALVDGWRLSRSRETEATREYAGRLDVRPPDPAVPVARLSGGNQQKVLLGRWLFAGSGVILLDEPTRGVDVSSRAEIYREISSLAAAGAAVVMVSSDLPELLGMSDRILVLRRGRLVAELDARSATQEDVLRHAALEEDDGTGAHTAAAPATEL
jgi:ABC-type sugar transport system ATPase subunit